MTISDPLEVVLDRVMEGHINDREVTYTINRLAALTAANTDVAAPDNLMSRSLGAFLARQRAEQQGYLQKVEKLWDYAKEAVEDDPQAVVVSMASQSGLPLDLLERLRQRISQGIGELPTTIEGWVDWTMDWLKADAAAREHLLRDVQRSATASAGKTAKSAVNGAVLDMLLPGIKGWISGKPLNEIERALGGDPDGKSDTAKMCPQARDLIATFIPRGLSFIMGVVSRMAEELNAAGAQEDLDEGTLQSLAAAVRRGFDTVGKLEFANSRRDMLGRVQIHKLYEERQLIFELDFDDDL